MPATLSQQTGPSTDQTPAVTLCDIMQQTTTYAVEVEGNQLAPRYRHGQTVVMVPSLGAGPSTLPAGSLVLAALEHPTKANLFEHFGLFTLTASGALLSGTCHIEAGKFLVLGVEALEAAPTSSPTDSDRCADCFDDHIRMCSDRHDGRPYHDPPMDSYEWHLMQ